MRLPLLNRPELYHHYYAGRGGVPQFAVAEQDGEYVSAAGYILANTKRRPDIWVSVWVAAKSHNGVGLELMNALPGLLNADVVACNNIRPNTCTFYQFLGWKAERLPWVFRFGLFGFGDPGSGIWMLILSMIVYGMAFDFFNISGSLFVELETKPETRASAQGLFFIMTNGLGAVIGGYASGAVVDAFSVYENGMLASRNWPAIWFIFAAYALAIGILFAIVFRYKHQPGELKKVNN